MNMLRESYIEFKGETRTKLGELRKELAELRESSEEAKRENREIKKEVQELKEKFNKDIEDLKDETEIKFNELVQMNKLPKTSGYANLILTDFPSY